MRMLIVNPIAGCGYALKVMEQVQSVLTARNLPFRVMRTEYPGYAAKLAREAVEMGCEAVYVIGGDGTFSEAARGLAGSGIPIGKSRWRHSISSSATSRARATRLT